LDGTHSVQYALNQGYILGFVAGTDSHYYGRNAFGKPGNWLKFLKFITGAPKLPGPGITGVYARSLTREDIWDALINRRTFATTGARIKVKFEIGGFFMGQVIPFEKIAPFPHLSFEIKGTSQIAKIEVIKNSQVIHTVNPKSKSCQASLSDQQPLKYHNYYYLRIHQQDGHMAWSSPVWIKK
jgi:hypothetical protein